MKLPAPKFVPPVRSVPTGPLSPGMRNVLVAMLSKYDDGSYGMTGNEIGYAVGYRSGEVKANVSGAAASGGCVRSMGAAQRVIPVLVALDRRGLITMAARRDRRSGTAYRLTPAGFEMATKLREETKLSDTRTDAVTADGGDSAVWVIAESYEVENLDPCLASDISFLPGNDVTFPEDHEEYPGEEGTVQAVGKGKGMYAGEIVYDVLVDGTDYATRVTESQLEGAA